LTRLPSAYRLDKPKGICAGSNSGAGSFFFKLSNKEDHVNGRDLEIVALKKQTGDTMYSLAMAAGLTYNGFKNYYYGFAKWPVGAKEKVLKYLKAKAKQAK
jgi:hypothetical protein